MAHQRKLIREHVVELLKAEVPEAGNRVYESRFNQLFGSAEQLPAISVYTLSETSEGHSSRPVVLQRTLRLAVEFLVKSSTDLDDTVDALALSIEKAMAKDVTLGRTCEDCTLVETEVQQNDEGKTPIGAARLSFDVIYISQF